MALWLVRAGRHGQHEQRFLDHKRVYLTWESLDVDLSQVDDRDQIKNHLLKILDDPSEGTVVNHAGQIWSFAKRIEVGDWVVLPSKSQPSIHIAEVKSDYRYDPSAEPYYRHFRDVEWLATDIPRSNFDQDLLYSFGAFMTVCRISRNDAEARVREMAENDWQAPEVPYGITHADEDDDGDEADRSPIDLERLGRDQIAKLIIQKFKGHGMARLVGEILEAQGYTVYRSPEGPDKGVDLLAAPGPLGFGHPRICVQVKSGTGPVDRPTLDQLIGTMQNVNAEHGLLVAWGGFKSSIDRERGSQFFRVRLWNQDDLIDELFTHYDQLDDEIRADLPLKRIWAVTLQEE